MLRLTRKAEYGLIALRHLAVRPPSASAKEIADSYGIPPALIAKVLQKLARGGLLVSIPGTNGGYRLARDPRTLSALEVIRSIDGPVMLTSCFTAGHECHHSERCSVREPLRKVHEGILALLDSITISEMAKEEPAALTLLGAL